MAELETAETTAASCCSSRAQETCCEPEAKSECCGDTSGTSCGCTEGTRGPGGDVRATVRERYAAAAVAASAGSAACCGDAAVITDEQRELFGAGLYGAGDRDALPDAAQLASLGCGNPNAVADEDMDEATRQDKQQWTGCIAGALTRDEYERDLAAAGFERIEIRETHRVHEHAGSAIVRAALPDR